MIRQSGAGVTLTTLHIYAEPSSLSVSLLKLTPNLEELKFGDDFSITAVLCPLAYLMDSPPRHLLPRLKRLTVLVPWEGGPHSSIFPRMHRTALFLLEKLPERPLQPDSLHRLQTFEVVLMSHVLTLPHEKQNHSRNLMEPRWQYNTHLGVRQPLALLQKRLSDVRQMVELGKENMDEVARDVTEILGQLMNLRITLIHDLYVSFFSRFFYFF